jgi:cell surface protein SprA
MTLIYENLPPLDTVYCYKTMLKDEDYTLYGRLLMWVHFTSEMGTSPIFFYRMGTRSDIYYEYSTRLEPGWATGNQVIIDFAEITALKNEYEMAVADTSRYYPIESNPVRVTEHGTYRIRGTPTLTQIRLMSMGVINPDPNYSISGEVWVDELRVTDVRNDPGSAKRVQVTTNFGDLLDFTGQITNKEDDFHGLTETKGSGSDETAGTVSTTRLYTENSVPRDEG